jgi:hypothetical protein
MRIFRILAPGRMSMKLTAQTNILGPDWFQDTAKFAREFLTGRKAAG